MSYLHRVRALRPPFIQSKTMPEARNQLHFTKCRGSDQDANFGLPVAVLPMAHRQTPVPDNPGHCGARPLVVVFGGSACAHQSASVGLSGRGPLRASVGPLGRDETFAVGVAARS